MEFLSLTGFITLLILCGGRGYFLASFSSDDLVLITDTLSFVGFRFLELSDLRRGFSYELLVYSGNSHDIFVDAHGNSFGNFEFDRMNITERKHKIFPIQVCLIAYTLYLENLGKTA